MFFSLVLCSPTSASLATTECSIRFPLSCNQSNHNVTWLSLSAYRHTRKCQLYSRNTQTSSHLMNTIHESRATHARPIPQALLMPLTNRVQTAIHNANWRHAAFKTAAFTYIALILWMTWQILPLPGHWTASIQSDKFPTTSHSLSNYFDGFDGHSDCSIQATDLYGAPLKDEHGRYTTNAFCPNRKTLLRAMSGGGRVGFDAAYIPKGCSSRWFSVEEICMILERFEALVFVGDSSLQSIYNGFNILLRKDLASGALQTWKMSSSDKAECRCENQFTKTSCAQHFVTSSEQVKKHFRQNVEGGNSYACSRIPHVFLDTSTANPTQKTTDEFQQIVPRAPRSNYKGIPIIHSISPMTASHKHASNSLLGFVRLADASERKTPMLWIGPASAGHIEVRGRKSNQEIWDFDAAVAKVAQDNDVEVLQMWNLTVQATSWDGMRFGESVALVQAMMVINWLSRLESS